MNGNLPPGYSLVTVRVFGKDIPLASVSDETLEGIQKILSGIRKGPPVVVKMPDGRKALGRIKKRTQHVTIIEVNGKEIAAREVKHNPNQPPRQMPIRTKVIVEKP